MRSTRTNWLSRRLVFTSSFDERSPKALLDGVQRENWIRVESQSWPRCPSERIFPEIHICFPATKAGGFTLKNREHTNAT